MTDKDLERAAGEWAECDRRDRGYTHQVAGIFKIGAVNGYIAGHKSRDAEIYNLQTVIKDLREALEFYADDDCEDCWQLNGDALFEHQENYDHSKPPELARAVLEKWK